MNFANFNLIRQTGRVSSLQLLIYLFFFQGLLAIIAWGIIAWRMSPPDTLLRGDERFLAHWRIININGTQDPAKNLTLTNEKERWLLPALDNLLVDAPRLSQVLQGLSQASKHTLLGEDVDLQSRFATTPSNYRTIWVLENNRGNKTTLYWGERLSAQAFAVRRSDSKKVYQWLMKSATEADRFESMSSQARGWIANDQFAIPGGRTRLIRIQGEDFTLTRPEQPLPSTTSSIDLLTTPSLPLTVKTLASWQWLDQPHTPVNSTKIDALTEALGELLIADVLPSTSAERLRTTPPINHLTFTYQIPPLIAKGASPSVTPKTVERQYTLYAWGNEVAIDFGGKSMVIPASSDGEVLKNARRLPLMH